MSPLRSSSPGDRLVIKKSEIRFSPQAADKSTSLLFSGKQLAFDFIKSMLGKETETAKEKKKFSKFGKPSP